MGDDNLPDGYVIDSKDDGSGSEHQPPMGYTLDQSEASPEAPPSGYELDSDKYTTPGQQALTVGEHFAKGIAGPFATAGEQQLSKFGVPGLSDQDILARQKYNPGEAAISETAGNVALFAALPEVEGVGALSQIGGNALKQMIASGLIAGGDEVSNSLLGAGGNPEDVASHIMAASALGLITGGIFGGASYGLTRGATAAESALSTVKAPSSFLAGVGHQLKYPGPVSEDVLKRLADMPEEFNPKDFVAGTKAADGVYKALSSKITTIVKYAAATKGGFLGWSAASPLGPEARAAGAFIGEKLGERVGTKLGEKASSVVSRRVVGPALLKLASNHNLADAAEAIQYAKALHKGAMVTNRALDALFTGSGSEGLQFIHSEKAREKLEEFQENGGVDGQLRQQGADGYPGFADGGEVQQKQDSNAISRNWPEQNLVLNAARMRVSNYLNTKKPQQKTGRPFDTHHENPEEKRQYHKVLGMALEPLSVLKRVKDGSLTTQDMQHFTAMYPELHNSLSKRIMERVTKLQMNDEKKPDYKMRQALSLFTGSDLDSTLTPQSIMAAQSVFMKNKMQQAPPKSGAMKNASNQAMTPEQARTRALNKT